MTFTEWYEEIKNGEWNEDYAELCQFVQELEDEYYAYCHEKNIEPIWNG